MKELVYVENQQQNRNLKASPFTKVALQVVRFVLRHGYFCFTRIANGTCISLDLEILIQYEYREIQTRKNSVFGHISRSATLSKPKICSIQILHKAKRESNHQEP